MVASCGEASVSAVSLVDSINILILQIFSALSTGGAVICAQYLGRGDRENASKAAGQLMLVTSLLSLGVMALALTFCGGILRVIYGDLDPLVMSHAKSYFYLTAAAYPFIALYNVSAALFRARGNSRVSMMTAFIMNLVNIVGNYIFIYIYKMDVAGAGLSTFLSRVASAVVMLWMLCHGDGLLAGVELRKIRYDKGIVASVLKVGIPSGLEGGIFQVGKLMVQGLIASFGTIALAANAMANSISSMTNIIGSAVGLAMITVVGQCVGADDYDGAHRYMLQLNGVSMAASVVICGALFIFARPLTTLYGLSAETAEIALEIVYALCLTQPLLWSGAFGLPCGLRASGDAKFTMVASIATMWVFRIGCSYLFTGVFHMGLMGVWAAMFVDWAARSAVFYTRFFTGGWRNRKVV